MFLPTQQSGPLVDSQKQKSSQTRLSLFINKPQSKTPRRVRLVPLYSPGRVRRGSGGASLDLTQSCAWEHQLNRDK